jgi:twitching motility two-component system response regulator PilH
MAKILVVEDDKKISMALALRLKSKGHEVFAAYDALGGVQAAAKNRPDLILMDISMPAGGGFTAAERIQNLAPTVGTPMIFMTASKDPTFRKRAEEAGAVAYFEKPYDADELMSTIEQTLGGGR